MFCIIKPKACLHISKFNKAKLQAAGDIIDLHRPWLKPTKLPFPHSQAKRRYALTQSSMNKLLTTGQISARVGPGVSSHINLGNHWGWWKHVIRYHNSAFDIQARFAHTDIEFPDYDDQRRSSIASPRSVTNATEASRKSFTQSFTIGSMGCYLYVLKSHGWHYVKFMSAAKDVLAFASAEVNLADIPVGKSGTTMWRKKPLFLRHRTPEEIAQIKAVPMSELKDPQRDEDRVQRDEWLITVGICTHLGCIPMVYEGDYGGYYCPCHGSHYDGSGRIRKGPAPTNLEIPPYKFLTDTTIYVG